MAVDEPLFFENFDLESIVTPVKAQHFVQLLKHSNYNPKEVQFLEQGFTNGFDIGYEGPVDHASTSSNLPLQVGNRTILWNKLMKEVKLGRVAGPFKSVPFKNFIQSPIGLVPKKGKDQTRLIFHLSYTFPDGKSVNELTPQSKCKVVYRDLNFAVKLCLLLRGNTNQPIFMGKTDAQSAFRILPLSRASWQWVIMKAINPVTRTLFYFVDKCLLFGASISCSHFQRVSDAIKYLLEFRTKIFNCICNYLDDFLNSRVNFEKLRLAHNTLDFSTGLCCCCVHIIILDEQFSGLIRLHCEPYLSYLLILKIFESTSWRS